MRWMEIFETSFYEKQCRHDTITIRYYYSRDHFHKKSKQVEFREIMFAGYAKKWFLTQIYF